MSLFNHLHLEGNISRIVRSDSPDGTICYDIRLAVEREDGSREFVNLKGFADEEYDPWVDYQRGMDCRFDCTVRSLESPDGTMSNVIVCLNAFPLPTKKTLKLIEKIPTDPN